MRAVVQRVKQAKVMVGERRVGEISNGLLVFLGVMQGDTETDARDLAHKIAALRVFEDGNGKMNHHVQETGGEILVVSQFTLAGDCRKGRRPSFDGAADLLRARSLYELFVEAIRAQNVPTATGEFQAMMEVHLINDGPVTLLLDSRKTF